MSNPLLDCDGNTMLYRLSEDNYFNDRPEEPGMEADEATRLIADEGVGGNPSQQKPPIMGLDCWNRCWWFFNIWVKTGKGGRCLTENIRLE